jgi:PAS domain S-box-containing protein
MRAVVLGGTAKRLECPLLVRPGAPEFGARHLRIAWQISPLGDPDGLLVLDGLDRTAQAEAEHALRRSERTFAALVEQVTDGIFVTDRGGVCTYVNRAGCRMLGYSRVEIVGRAIEELIAPGNVGRLASAKAFLLRPEPFRATEWKLLRKDGTHLAAEVIATILPDGRPLAIVRDATEAARLAGVLQVTRTEMARSESHLRAIMDNAYQFIGLLAPDGTLLEANQSALQLVAARREDLIGRPFWETPWWTADREQQQRLKDAIASAASGHFVRFEATHPAADGRTVHVDFSLTPVRDARGPVVYLVPEGRDITDRKRLEAGLRVSEARLSGLVSIASDAIVSIDEHQRIVLYNQGAQHIFGWKRDEVLGEPLDRLIPPRFWDIHRQHVQDFEKEPAPTRHMAHRRAGIFGLRKNGQEFPAEASISKIEVEGKHLFTVVLRDVSERVAFQHEQNRHLAEQRFLADLGATLTASLDPEKTLIRVAELLAANLADFCIVFALDGDEIRRVKVAYRDPARAAVAEALERQPLDATQQSAVRAVILSGQPRLVRELTPELVRSIVQNERHYERLAELDPRSGLAVPLVAQGRALGAFVLLSSSPDRRFGDDDVTLATLVAARTALSLDALHLLESARDATRVRDEVLGFVAHDLRNPLAAIDLAAQHVASQLPADADMARRGIEAIARGCARANRLINGLLDIRRAEDGRLPLSRQPLSPAQMAVEAVETQGLLAAAASLSLELDIPEELPPVWADNDRISEVFDNLIGNAMKFTPPGGRISIGVTEREEDVLFSVRDTGPGIHREDLPHLFDLFWQGRPAAHGGAGLGLPIARSLVEAHGGRIWVESEEGAGCTVLFTLPKAIGEAAATAAQATGDFEAPVPGH